MSVRRMVVWAAAALGLVLGILLYEQAGPRRTAPGWIDLSPQELSRLLDEGGVTLVNVHVPYEGEIPGTDLFIPYDAVRARVGELPGRDAAIALYCRRGPMSREAAQTLVTLGYRRVYVLRGGFEAWRQAGFPFVVKRTGVGGR